MLLLHYLSAGNEPLQVEQDLCGQTGWIDGLLLTFNLTQLQGKLTGQRLIDCPAVSNGRNPNDTKHCSRDTSHDTVNDFFLAFGLVKHRVEV